MSDDNFRAQGPATRNSVNHLGFSLFAGELQVLADQVFQHISECQSKPLVVNCLNPHSIATARSKPVFRKALKTSDYLLADGAGLLLGRLLVGGDIFGRVTGSDFFEVLSERLSTEERVKVFFLGSTPEVLKALATTYSREYGRHIDIETFSPPYVDNFSSSQNEEILTRINEARPDVLWVGLGAPKQEIWVYKNLECLDVKVVASVGAVFDFYSQDGVRPSRIWRSIGLEWFMRLIQEPRRMWRRSVVSVPIYCFLLMKEFCRCES